MGPVLTSVCLILLGLSVVGGLYYAENVMDDDNQYKDKNPANHPKGGLVQGPVRPSDDLEHFRNTGETKPKDKVIKIDIDKLNKLFKGGNKNE